MDDRVSERVIARMRWYLYALEDLEKQGQTVASSRTIAEKVGVKPGLVRKDLSQFGGFGRPSVGYNTAYLQRKIREILRVDEERKIAWVGARHLEGEPSLIARFADANCRLIALFGDRQSDVGQEILGMKVLGVEEVERVVREMGVHSAVIACPAEHAQDWADRLISGGVTAILNLSPCLLNAPLGVSVRNLDIVGEVLALPCVRIEEEHEE